MRKLQITNRGTLNKVLKELINGFTLSASDTCCFIGR